MTMVAHETAPDARDRVASPATPDAWDVVPPPDLGPWTSLVDRAPWNPAPQPEPPWWSESEIPARVPEFRDVALTPFTDGQDPEVMPQRLPEFPVAHPRLPVSTLAGRLESIEVADLPDDHVVNAIVGWEQVIAAARAAQAVAVRELAARSGPDVLRVAGDELGCALACTRPAAVRLVARALQSAEFPVLADAWSAGLIGTRKVDVILDEVALAPAAAAAPIVADAVAAAGERTPPQLARDVRAAVIAADGAAAARRAARGRADRRVELTPVRDAMAWVSAFLPADQATAVFTTVDALAGATRVAGDDRTVDQRRADAFADVFLDMLDRQATPGGTPLPTRGGRRVSLQVAVAASTLLGLDDAPGYLGSYGPIPAGMARELAQDGTWRRVLTDAAGQVCEVGSATYRPGADLTRLVQARDQTCTFPGCRQPAERCDLDHRRPYDHGLPGDEQTVESNLHCLCRHHHQAKTSGHWKVTYDRSTGVSTWTSPLGITYARHPQPLLAAPTSYEHGPPPTPPPARRDLGDPPF